MSVSNIGDYNAAHGVVREIFVEEGQRVAAGQPLFRLDGTLAEASLRIVDGELEQLLALDAMGPAHGTGAGAMAPLHGSA